MSATKHLPRAAAIGACLITLLHPLPADALDLPVPVDKAAHFGLSYVVTDQLIRLGTPREKAVAITVFAGFVKEVLDRPFDPYDLGADVAGALAAGYLRVELTF